MTTVVRGLGYAVTHVVTIPSDAVQDCAWPSPAYPFRGVSTPLMARCGHSVRSVQPFVAVMASGTRVSCRQCRMFSGVEVQS
jgi:hypothetical protein